jgi:hypothetical protein
VGWYVQRMHQGCSQVTHGLQHSSSGQWGTRCWLQAYHIPPAAVSAWLLLSQLLVGQKACWGLPGVLLLRLLLRVMPLTRLLDRPAGRCQQLLVVRPAGVIKEAQGAQASRGLEQCSAEGGPVEEGAGSRWQWQGLHDGLW